MNDYTNFEEKINHCASEEGFSLLKALETFMNSIMLIEREKVLKAKPFERTENRQGYSNGFKPKTDNTQLGAVALKIPQTRGIYQTPFKTLGFDNCLLRLDAHRGAHLSRWSMCVPSIFRLLGLLNVFQNTLF